MYCSQRDHHSGPAGHLAPAARPSPHSHHRSCQVVDARPSGSKICRHEGDRPAVPAQRRPCPPNTAGRLSGTRHYRSDYRRSTAPLPDGQALASRHSLRVGRSTCRVRVCFLSAPATVPSHLRRVSPPIADDPKRDAKIGRQRQAPLLAASCSVLRHRDKPARGRGRVFAGLFHKNQKIRKNNDCVAEEAV